VEGGSGRNYPTVVLGTHCPRWTGIAKLTSKICDNKYINNSILIYLCANLTAQRPTTELPPVWKKKQQNIKNKIKTWRVYIVITIIIFSLKSE
jgi:hypothetical protein